MNLKPTESFVETSQGNIAIFDIPGTGRPVVFLHGNSACKECFSYQYENLAGKYRCILIDLPGHGHSQKARNPESAYTIEGYAETAIEILNKLQLDHPYVIGWSLGGHIGLNMIQKGTKLAALILSGTPPIELSSEGMGKGFVFNPRIAELFPKVDITYEEASDFMTGGGIDPEKDKFLVDAAFNTDGYARKRLAQSMIEGIGGDQKTFVETDDTPLCIIQGEDDQVINNDYIKGLNYKNLIGEVHFIEGGHAVFRQKPKEFNAIIELFLSQIG